jgi:hypothetical protein
MDSMYTFKIVEWWLTHGGSPGSDYYIYVGKSGSISDFKVTFKYKYNGGDLVTIGTGDTNGTGSAAGVNFHPVYNGTYDIYINGSIVTNGDEYGGTINFTYGIEPPTAPTVPTNIVCPDSAMAGTNITLSWNPSTDVNGDSIMYYVYLDNGTTISYVTTTSSTSISYTTPNIMAYCRFRVKASDGTLSSDYGYSNYISISNNIAPNAPTSITVPSSAAAKSTVNVFWDSPNQSVYDKYYLKWENHERTTETSNIVWGAITYCSDRTTASETFYNSYQIINYAEDPIKGVAKYPSGLKGDSTFEYDIFAKDITIGFDKNSLIGKYLIYNNDISNMTVFRINAVHEDKTDTMGVTYFEVDMSDVYNNMPVKIKDTYIGQVTAPYNTYPQDGIGTDNYWYTYKGTSPSVDVDGDTISYKLEFYNGTAWTTCGTTTATNMNYVLPDIEVTTAKFRVTATDSRGGASGSITSSAFTIYKILIYMDIDGQVKRFKEGSVKIDGTLRKIAEVYIKVNDVLKKV